MKWYKQNIHNVSETEYQKWYTLLSAQKRARVDRMTELARKQSVCGEMLAKRALADLCGLTPESIVLRTDSHGKPFAEDVPAHFSISHSGELVVCAVDQKAIGIDVERLRAIDKRVALRICTVGEIAYVERDSDKFFEIWTAKEAHFKRLGLGIATDLKKYDALKAKDWVKLDIDIGYAASVSQESVMYRILFVCHGNICRSPMAEFVFRKMCLEAGKEDVLIASAATSSEEIWGGVGNPVYPPAARILANHGIDCSGKRAILLQKSDYDQYDLIVGMDDNNIRNMMRLFKSDPKHKICKMKDFIGGGNVADPWYSGDFETTYNEIYESCKVLLEQIK